jgi:hypothetical protein
MVYNKELYSKYLEQLQAMSDRASQENHWNEFYDAFNTYYWGTFSGLERDKDQDKEK